MEFIKMDGGSQLRRLVFSPLLGAVLPPLAISLMLLSLAMIFLWVPDERVMGAVQRIFYFHVASAMVCYGMIGVLLVGSVTYLAKREGAWDDLANGAAGIALLFSTIVLLSGMVWGRSAWNTWWRWEPRLVSFLVLWLTLFAYHVLRSVTDRDGYQTASAAVLGVLAAANVPLVIFSMKLLTRQEQLHPEVLAGEGLADPRFVITLISSVFALGTLGVWLLSLRLQQLAVEHRLTELALAYDDRRPAWSRYGT